MRKNRSWNIEHHANFKCQCHLRGATMRQVDEELRAHLMGQSKIPVSITIRSNIHSAIRRALKSKTTKPMSTIDDKAFHINAKINPLVSLSVTKKYGTQLKKEVTSKLIDLVDNAVDVQCRIRITVLIKNAILRDLNGR